MKWVASVGAWLVRGMALLGAASVLATATPAVEYWTRWLAGDWGSAQGEVLVVLLGSPSMDEVLAENTYWRCVYTVRAMKERSYRRILFVGAGASAASLRRFVASNALPTDRIEFESASGSTRENALYASTMLKGEKGRIVLLTSDYHCRRSVAAFQKVGIPVHGAPAPDALKSASTWSRRWSAVPTLAIASVKLVYDRFKGWI